MVVERLHDARRADITVCYWGCLLAPLLYCPLGPLLVFVMLAMRRPRDDYRWLRFHAFQALLVLLLASFVLIAFPMLYLLGVASVMGLGFRVPVVSGRAARWSGHQPSGGQRLLDLWRVAAPSAKWQFFVLLIAGLFMAGVAYYMYAYPSSLLGDINYRAVVTAALFSVGLITGGAVQMLRQFRASLNGA